MQKFELVNFVKINPILYSTSNIDKSYVNNYGTKLQKEYANKYTLSEINLPKETLNLNNVPDLKGKSLSETISILQRYGVKYKISGSGFCSKQNPEPGEVLNKEDVWSIYFE